MQEQQFNALIEREQQRLTDFETTATAAQAAEEGAQRAVVAAKLDGKPPAEIRRLEADAEAAVQAQATAERQAARQREQINALREEFSQRTHREAVAALQAEIETARSSWPVALERFDALIAPLQAVWAEMQALKTAETAALRRLERLDPALSDGIYIPTPVEQQFPITQDWLNHLHWTREQRALEAAERRARYEAGQAFVAHLEQMGNRGDERPSAWIQRERIA